MEIDGLPGFVHRPIQIHPFAALLYIGLVHPPGSAHSAGKAPPALLEFRRVVLHPPQNRRVRQAQAPFAHYGDQVSIAELKAQIPADAQDHDLLIEMSTFEQFLDRYESRHPSIIAECGRVCTRALLRPLRQFRRGETAEGSIVNGEERRSVFRPFSRGGASAQLISRQRVTGPVSSHCGSFGVNARVTYWLSLVAKLPSGFLARR